MSAPSRCIIVVSHGRFCPPRSRVALSFVAHCTKMPPCLFLTSTVRLLVVHWHVCAGASSGHLAVDGKDALGRGECGPQVADGRAEESDPRAGAPGQHAQRGCAHTVRFTTLLYCRKTSKKVCHDVPVFSNYNNDLRQILPLGRNRPQVPRQSHSQEETPSRHTAGIVPNVSEIGEMSSTTRTAALSVPADKKSFRD